MSNFTKYEVAGISLLKRVTVAVCSMKSVDLTSDTLKILGVHFSYTKTLQSKTNFLKAIWIPKVF